MNVSIVIVNYNTKELLKQVLTSIMQNIKKISYEVVVIDNNSSDGSTEYLKTNFNNVKIIENKLNFGTSKANNQGAEIAKGECLLFLNSDTIVCENALENMYEFLENEKSAGAVGCKLLNEDGSLQRSCGIFPNLLTEFYLRSYLSRLFPDNKMFGTYKLTGWDYSSIRKVDWATSACLMVRKDIFEKAGGFDENIFMFYDEVDFCLRINKWGKSIYFIPDVSVYHLHGGTWSNYREIPISNSCKNALYFFRKHYKKWKIVPLKFFILMEILISYFIFIPYLMLSGKEFAGIKSRLRGYQACLKHVIFG